MVKPAEGFNDVFVFDTKTFSKFWGDWIKQERFTNVEYDTGGGTYSVENDWETIHKFWREFVLGAWEVISDLEDNKWTKTWATFKDDDDEVFKYFSPKCYNKIRSIQKTLAKREGTDWQLVFTKTKKGAQRIDWDKSMLPPAPFGMKCRTANPPKKGKPRTTIWDEVESYFA